MQPYSEHLIKESKDQSASTDTIPYLLRHTLQTITTSVDFYHRYKNLPLPPTIATFPDRVSFIAVELLKNLTAESEEIHYDEKLQKIVSSDKDMRAYNLFKLLEEVK